MTPEQQLQDGAEFNKASYSGAQDSCVAIGRLPGMVGAQDTKEDPDSKRRTTLAFSAETFTAFLDKVKRGGYDH